MNLVTIIIPMFNEEENIKKCIKSLKNQLNQNFSVIFIDDGSTDNTILILQDELKDDTNFKYQIIRQKNQGAAAARKSGINYSITDYIMFYDCDDMLSTNMVQEFYKTYRENQDVDIVIPKLSNQNQDGSWKDFKFYSTDKLLNPLDCIKNSLGKWEIHGCFSIKKNIILKSYNDYKKYNPENENFINNDEVITRLNFLNSRKIVRSNGIYYYCYNPNSTTKKINQMSYLRINNALIMDQIFSHNPMLYYKTKIEVVSTIWEKFRYIQIHKNELNNLNSWNALLKESINKLNYFELLKILSARDKAKLSILKILYSF